MKTQSNKNAGQELLHKNELHYNEKDPQRGSDFLLLLADAGMNIDDERRWKSKDRNFKEMKNLHHRNLITGT